MFLIRLSRRAIHSSNNLKIYSFIPERGGFRLTNGQIKDFKVDPTADSGLAIIGPNHFDWDGSVEGIRAVLRLLRPVPEILVVASAKFKDEAVKIELKKDFGCSVEAFEDRLGAATTFNALIDDNRLTIGFFSS